MLLSELLTTDRIRIPLVSTSKDDLLGELTAVIAATAAISSVDELLRAIRDREEVLSTGIGNGVAIPHGRSATVDDLVLVAGVTSEPVDFDALDGRPVQLLFLLVGPESAAGQHVKVLSRISRLLRKDSMRERLAAATSPEQFHSALTEAERA